MHMDGGRYRLRRGSRRGLLRVRSEGGRGCGCARLRGVRRGGGHGRGRGGREDVRRIRAEALEVAAYLRLELLERVGLDVQLPLQVRAHLALHLVDLPEGEHTLADDRPRLIRIGVVADHLGSDHERRNK